MKLSVRRVGLLIAVLGGSALLATGCSSELEISSPCRPLSDSEVGALEDRLWSSVAASYESAKELQRVYEAWETKQKADAAVSSGGHASGSVEARDIAESTARQFENIKVELDEFPERHRLQRALEYLDIATECELALANDYEGLSQTGQVIEAVRELLDDVYQAEQGAEEVAIWSERGMALLELSEARMKEALEPQ